MCDGMRSNDEDDRDKDQVVDGGTVKRGEWVDVSGRVPFE